MTKQIVYYTDNQLDEEIATKCRKRLRQIADDRGMKIVCSSLKPMDFGDINLSFPELTRGAFTLFKQQLAAVEACTADVLFFCEHDVLYHPSHFYFEPYSKETYYYNHNAWRVRFSDGHGLYVNNLRQTSGLCAYRELLLQHYRRRIEIILERQAAIRATGGEMKNDGISKYMAYEPGGHMKPRGVDEYPAKAWHSEWPNIDIRHGGNFTSSRWTKEEYHDKKFADGWTENDNIPGWGHLKYFWKRI